jgi:hypothetical protein
MSLYFEWVHICVRVVEYDLHMLIVVYCIKCIIYAENKVVSGSSQFGPRNVNDVAQEGYISFCCHICYYVFESLSVGS